MSSKITKRPKDNGEVTYKTYSLVDLSVGEIYKEIRVKINKDTDLTLEVDEHSDLLLTPNIPIFKDMSFAKLFMGVELPNYDSDMSLAYWLKLSKHLSPNTNVISVRGRSFRDTRPMTVTEMLKVVGKGERTFKEFMKESIEKFIIVENVIHDGSGIRVQYVMNPLYVFNGNELNYYVYELFKNDPKFQNRLNNKTKTFISKVEAKILEYNQIKSIESPK